MINRKDKNPNSVHLHNEVGYVCITCSLRVHKDKIGDHIRSHIKTGEDCKIKQVEKNIYLYKGKK